VADGVCKSEPDRCFLGQLAQRVGASVIVFGSDYRTPVGRAEPGTFLSV
jgi:hypothetical protein